MDKIIIGIDTGANGSIAWIKDNKAYTTKNSKDILVLKSIFDGIKEAGDCICYIEKVQMYHSDSMGGKQFGIKKLLDHYQQFKDVLTFCSIDFIEVHPVTWQTYLKLKSGFKNETKVQRKARYKNYASSVFKLKATNYNADALLIALYGFKQYYNENSQNQI